MLGETLGDYAWLISYILSCARLFNILVAILIFYVYFIFILNNLFLTLLLMVISFFEAVEVWFEGMRGLLCRYVILIRYELKARGYDWVLGDVLIK